MFDITPYLKPDDPFIGSIPHEQVQAYYDLKYRIARIVQPRSILEIGVRAGYSAAAFIAASSPDVKYVGLDFDNSDADIQNRHGGLPGYSQWAIESLKAHFPRASIEIVQIDTQVELIQLDGIFDLVHVDGDHSYEGCYRDLVQVERYARWILVDDYFHIADVKSATDCFLSERKHESVSLTGLRGEKVISLGENDGPKLGKISQLAKAD